jgi:phosphatidylserine/phosphatidylglycerophosphate/cardiolipin synthase-like enzyme
LIVGPDDGREPLLAEIDGARESIEIAVYTFTDPDMLAAVGRAAARGVRVRALLERDPYLGAGSPDADRAALERAGVEVRWAPTRFTFLHEKAMIVDAAVAVIGTMNFTSAGFLSNRELALVTTDPAEVMAASTVFEADWDERPTPALATLISSPENSRIELAGLLESATRSLDIYAEVLLDGASVDLLAQRAGAEVAVRVLLPPPFEDRGWLVVERLAASGVQLHDLSDPYGHAKAILVDGREAFVGSQNLTATSLDENRELGITFTEPTAIARLATTFERDFAGGGALVQV